MVKHTKKRPAADPGECTDRCRPEGCLVLVLHEPFVVLELVVYHEDPALCKPDKRTPDHRHSRDYSPHC